MKSPKSRAATNRCGPRCMSVKQISSPSGTRKRQFIPPGTPRGATDAASVPQGRSQAAPEKELWKSVGLHVPGYIDSSSPSFGAPADNVTSLREQVHG